MNAEKLLRAAFDFQPYSSNSVADQTSSSGKIRQEKYEDLLDAVIDARGRIARQIEMVELFDIRHQEAGMIREMVDRSRGKTAERPSAGSAPAFSAGREDFEYCRAPLRMPVRSFHSLSSIVSRQSR